MSRAIVFMGADQPLQIRDIAERAPAAGEILVQIQCCTLCRSDLHTFQGLRQEAVPTILGHECVGRILAFGPHAPRNDDRGQVADIGRRITWAVNVGCGECFYCREELPQKCVRPFKYGHERWHSDAMPTGGLADAVMLVPGTKWFCVPEQLSDPVAALANCAIATAAAACRQYGIVKNRHVAVLGAGVLGVAAVAMACHGGAQTIIAVDPNADCRARALRFGATHVFDNRDKDLSDQLLHATDGRGPDLVLEFSGADDAVELALNIGRIGATIILAGSVAPSRPIYVDPERIVRRMYNLHGVHNYHPRDLGTALAFLAETNQRFSWNDMIADQLPLTETTTAFRLAQQNVGVRVAVVP